MQEKRKKEHETEGRINAITRERERERENADAHRS